MKTETIKELKTAIKEAFGDCPVAMSTTLLATMDGYNKLVEIVNSLEQAEPEKAWPQVGDEYFTIHPDGKVVMAGWDDDDIDNHRKNFGRVFRTREQAVFQRDLNAAKAKAGYFDIYYRFCQFAKEVNVLDNGEPWVADWKNNDQLKWTLQVYHSTQEMLLERWHNLQCGNLPAFKEDVTDELRQRFTFEQIAVLMNDYSKGLL